MNYSITKYMQIESTYRDRYKYPIPSDFAVQLSPSGQYQGNKVNPVSNQVILFPPQNPIGSSLLQWEPLAFYTEQLQSPLDTIVERDYLPYVFSYLDSQTTLRIDELPISSTDSTTTTVNFPTDLQRGVIELGQADNFYINNYIENMATGELKKIIGMDYDSTETVLQSGNIVAYTLNNTVPQVQLRQLPWIDYPPSNIDRFYQGKYIRFSNDLERLIVNFFINDAGSPIIVLDQPLSEVPEMGSDIVIYTTQSWLVTIESAFATSIPRYPAYRDPLPDAFATYNKYSITNTSNILAIAAVRHTNNTIGVVFQTATNLSYVTSTDSSGENWGSVIDINTLDSNTEDSYSSATLHSIDVKLIDGNPAVVYTQLTLTATGVRYIRASSAVGATWNSSVSIDSDISVSHNNVRLASRPDSDTPNEGYPMIVYTDSTGALNLALGSVSFDSPTFGISNPLTVDGDAIDINTQTHVEDFSGSNWSAGTNLQVTGILYRNTTTGFPTYIFSDPSEATGNWATPTVLLDESIEIYGNLSVHIDDFTYSSITRSVRYLSAIFKTSSGDIYYNKQYVYNDVDVLFFFRINEFFISTVTDVNPLIYLISPIQTPTITDNLIYAQTDLIQLQPITTELINGGPPATIENAIINTFAVLPNLDETNTIVIYSSDNSALNIITPSATVLVEGVQYRIREGTPSESGIGGTSTGLLGGDLTTIEFPSSVSSVDDAYNGYFVWIYNQNVYNIPSPFHMFNDYRQIIDYDGATRTATVSTPFSADIQTLSIDDGNTVNWELLQITSDSTHPLVYVGTTVSVQQMVCYEVSLISLILPNITLATGQGNLIAFYPYVWVEFVNETAQNKNIIYSNNPNSTKMLFQVPISNLVDPSRSTFVGLNGSGMKQTIKFKPYDNFKISITLPNGELFQTLEQDTTPPFPPNPNIQVSATFGMRRLD